MGERRSKQGLSDQALNPDDLRVWQHPTLVNAIEVLEVFSIEPRDGRLAASLVLASDRLVKHLERNKGKLAQVQAALATRGRAFDWLRNDVNSEAYHPDPSRSTNQIDKALNCALLLFCAQTLQNRLPRQTREKAYSYIAYMSEQGWPRDDLLPFVVAQLAEPRGLVASAKQYLSNQTRHWRSEADIRGIAFALIQQKNELEDVVRDELVATMKAQLATASLGMSAKAWGLLALSGVQEVAKSDLDNIAESILDELSQDRLVRNEITPTVRLVNQFPFSTPDEIAHRVSSLKRSGYAPASRITRVDGEGVLIDLFKSPPDESWSFALSATEVAFVTFVLIMTGYYEIVGFPAHYRTRLEESVRRVANLQDEKATIIPIRYVKWYNVFAVLVMLPLGGVVGALVAELSGGGWLNGGLVGVALAAIVSCISVLTQEFVIVGMWEWIRKLLENLLGALGKK